MSHAATSAGGDVFSKHRVEALADAVFAVVMTLLVLEIKPELDLHAGNEEVRHSLRTLGLPLLAYAVTFFISCAFWILHHRKFHLLRHTNPVHTGLTLLFLFTVTLLPISISIYVRAKNSGLAQAVYFGNFTLIALTLLGSWLYAKRAGLVEPTAPAASRIVLTRRMLTFSSVGTIATVATYFSLPYLIALAVPVVLFLRRRYRPYLTPASAP